MFTTTPLPPRYWNHGVTGDRDAKIQSAKDLFSKYSGIRS